MLKIKFSHEYVKMLDMDERIPKEVTLIEVLRANSKDLHPRFVEYDTKYWDSKINNWAYYKLPEGEVIILLFRHPLYNNRIFTTIRRYTKEKHEYYLKNRWQSFKIEMEKENEQ